MYDLVYVGLAAFETDDVLTVTGRAQNCRPFAYSQRATWVGPIAFSAVPRTEARTQPRP